MLSKISYCSIIIKWGNRLCYKVQKNACNFYSGQNDTVVKSSLPDIRLQHESIDEYLWPTSLRCSEETALVCGVSGKKLKFYQVYDKSRALGRALRRKLKLKEGDTVAVLSANTIDVPIIYLAAIYANLVTTALIYTDTPWETAQKFRTTDPKCVFVHSAYYERFVKLLKKVINLERVKIVIVPSEPGEAHLQNTIKLQDLYRTKLDEIEATKNDLNETSSVMFTSGSTGTPKPVRLTRSNILWNVMQLTELAKVCGPNDHTKDAFLPLLPFNHVFGVNFGCLTPVSLGLPTILLPVCDMKYFLRAMLEHRPSIMQLSPIHIKMLLEEGLVNVKHMDSVRQVTCVAGSLKKSTVEKFYEKYPYRIKLRQGYCLTEAPIVTLPIDGRTAFNRGTVGQLVPNTEAKIVKTGGESEIGLGPKVIGELLIRGPQVTSGYMNDANAKGKAFTSNGWFRTGDLAYYNKYKQFYVLARVKNLIQVNGKMVLPQKLEDILTEHPFVDDAAVISVPHVCYGSVPKAFIIAKRGYKLNPEDVEVYVNERVEDFQKIRGGVYVIDSLPRSPAGTILHCKLYEC